MAATPVLLPVAIRGPARAPVAARREVESDRREAHPADHRADGGVAGGAGGAAVDVLNGNVRSSRLCAAAHFRDSVLPTLRQAYEHRASSFLSDTDQDATARDGEHFDSQARSRVVEARHLSRTQVKGRVVERATPIYLHGVGAGLGWPDANWA